VTGLDHRRALEHQQVVPGAHTVATPLFQMTQVAVQELVDEQEVGVVWGEAGEGKTYAVMHAVRQDRHGLEVAEAVFPPRMGLSMLGRELLWALTGVRHTGERDEVTLELIDALSRRPRLVVIDEADRLAPEGQDFLRYLFGHPRTRFALLLVGGPDLRYVLATRPMLDSRLYVDVKCDRMDEAQVLETIPDFHPVWAHADVDLIQMLNEDLCHGSFRQWAKATKRILGYLRREGSETVTRQIAEATVLLQANKATARRGH